MTKKRRLELVDKAEEGAGLALARLEKLSLSGNPDTAALATAMLIVERNEAEDLKALRALLENRPAAQLKAIPEEKIRLLAALETAIDARIEGNRLVNSGLAAVTETLRTAEAIGQMIGEAV
jgi:hypothetical protein